VATPSIPISEPPGKGLTEAEATRRLAARARPAKEQSSRSYASIVRANVFTLFNLILAVFGVLVIAFGDPRDALFVGILVANSAIGIFQEVRAKRALDRLAALVQPTATVVREGTRRHVGVDELAVGDRVELQAGDQVVADGMLVAASGLSLDESILTGEASQVDREVGEQVRSGSFAIEGTGAFVVTAVGTESYAARVAGEARAFRHPRSPLERAINRLLLALAGVIVPLGGLLGYALWTQHAATGVAVSKSAAAVVTLVPEGLILLASLTYAVAAIRMSRRGALVQQLNAVESLAAVDALCLDKTGTLTEPKPFVLEVVPADGEDPAALRELLARYAASASSRNATLEAIAAAFPGRPEQPEREVAFSSRRKWSALELGNERLVLAAPELLALGGLARRAAQEASAGRRVVAFARAPALPAEVTLDAAPPAGAVLLGLVVIGEKLRREARETVQFFREQGIELKVLSGDHPDTVAAIAREAGIPLDGDPLDGSDLDPARALAAPVIGRITPEGKRAVIEALREHGRYVAMVGDGVNDVPALKAARLAIAQGSGAQMARSVADLVLVSGDFAAVPAMVAEGRKLLRNLARVAELFVTKSAFATFLILSIGLTETAYPLLPRHLTLAATVTIGIPAFFLALAPSSGPVELGGFLRSVARFAVPAGTAAGLAVLSTYLFALDVAGRPLVESRTVATTTLVLVGLYLVYVLEGRGRQTRRILVLALCAAMLALYALAFVTPAGRGFFDLALGPALPASLAGAALAAALLWLTDERFAPAFP
jgi:cation-transporting ATPase E